MGIKALRGDNSKLVLQQIFNNENISRAQISKNLNLNKATVSSIFNELEEQRLVEKHGEGDSTKIGGRKPIMLNINRDYGYTIALDMGYDYLDVMLNYFNGKMISYNRYQLKVNDLTNVLSVIREKIDFSDKKETLHGLLGIGISVHGVVDNNYEITYLPFLDLQGMSVIEELKKMVDVPISIENEANLAAIFERDFGDKVIDNLITISIHKGIGAGLIIDGELYRGWSGEAGEIGRMLIHSENEVAGSTYRIEDVCSQDAIINKLKIALKKEIELDDVQKLYYQNNVIVKKEINYFVHLITEVVHNVNVEFNPEIIYLNSPLIEKIPIIIDQIKAELKVVSSKKVTVKLSSNVELSTLLGAMSAITHRVLDMGKIKIKF
ncbi:ROK family transcriptional regulator [Dellaglioa algida]|uniref:Sugar kinase n=1 Tax=Dellaglioa algida TaxID=105612 RepID=A0A5C6MCX7_9LACO|nr:ROK family transcriptional regulator [Dellaglioa algida]MDK1716077.1 ROK family transcriptional regulator [Dellaglioa algida]MDK1719358.1 ROK family transcriptional regulator [Dellaglioa algida]MDK1721140.1 ROK family transcriptional regulator [Dellaglioa algida]MDK1722701.1 ROK family transcriptional regulator [Dellaglioa algida]MDK1724320.1 ROK family transcriptional regulator [Dellaglioa algida]